jgi:hypothetical protein
MDIFQKILKDQNISINQFESLFCLLTDHIAHCFHITFYNKPLIFLRDNEV